MFIKIVIGTLKKYTYLGPMPRHCVSVDLRQDQDICIFLKLQGDSNRQPGIKVTDLYLHLSNSDLWNILLSVDLATDQNFEAHIGEVTLCNCITRQTQDPGRQKKNCYCKSKVTVANILSRKFKYQEWNLLSFF